MPRDSADVVADRAMAEGAGITDAVPIRSTRRVVAVTGFIGIAAALTLFVVARRDRSAAVDAMSPVPVADSTSIAVEVPHDRNAIVFATKNPNISVVWIY